MYDFILLEKYERDIHDLDIKFLKAGVDLDKEDDAAEFLGVTLERNKKTGLIEMRQDGLIERIVEALVLYDGTATKNNTPSEGNPLVKDKDGPSTHGNFRHSSVAGIMLYLAVHKRTNIDHSFNCCARYMFALNNFHELVLKRIAHSLKATTKKGLVLNPYLLMCKLD